MTINIFCYNCVALDNSEILVVYDYFRNIGPGTQSVLCALLYLILTMSWNITAQSVLEIEEIEGLEMLSVSS